MVMIFCAGAVSQLETWDYKPELIKHDGKPLEGRLRPSSDLPTHVELYRHFPALGGIVHTHSTWATAWSRVIGRPRG